MSDDNNKPQLLAEGAHLKAMDGSSLNSKGNTMKVKPTPTPPPQPPTKR